MNLFCIIPYFFISYTKNQINSTFMSYNYIWFIPGYRYPPLNSHIIQAHGKLFYSAYFYMFSGLKNNFLKLMTYIYLQCL